MALNPTGYVADLACHVTGAPLSSGWFSCDGPVLRLGPWSAIIW